MIDPKLEAKIFEETQEPYVLADHVSELSSAPKGISIFQFSQLNLNYEYQFSGVLVSNILIILLAEEAKPAPRRVRRSEALHDRNEEGEVNVFLAYTRILHLEKLINFLQV